MEPASNMSVIFAGAMLLSPLPSAAEETAQGWIAGAQITSVNQVNTRVSRGPFTPDLSFGTEPSYGWSLTASLFRAVSPWRNGVLVLMPEYANSRGLSNASGIGGYLRGTGTTSALTRAPWSTAPLASRIGF